MQWQSVYKSEQQYRAEMVRSILEEKGLEPVVISKQDSVYRLGYHEVCVQPDEVIKALKIINDEIRFN